MNLAHAVWQWEEAFSSYPLYMAMLLGIALVVFVLVQRLGAVLGK